MDRDSQSGVNEEGRTVSLDSVRYDKHTGLVPVVVQDIETKQVLMTAYANREALKRTYGTGQAWFWSRSRQSYWRKGETSGNVLHVREVRLDCDGDTVLFLVKAAGPACHTGNTSCFYRSMVYKGGAPGERSRFAGDDTGIVMEEADMIEDLGHFEDPKSAPANDTKGLESAPEKSAERVERAEGPERAERVGNPASDPFDTSVLQQLWTVVEERYHTRPQGSYTTFLFEHGMDKIAKKVGEEATEVVIAGKNADGTKREKQELAQESADLLYHLLVLWMQAGISPDDVFRVLADRTQ